MFEPDENGVYARVSISGARRMFAIAVFGALGLFFLWVALANPPAFLWQAVLVAAGLGSIWHAVGMVRRESVTIELTETELRDTTGRTLARMTDIVSIDRGAFAIKPSNGFALVLNQRMGRAWVPGLWWRVGRRVGIGGTTHAGEAKFMAEQLALRIHERDTA